MSTQSAGLTFTGMALDRASVLRSDPQWLARRLRERDTRAVAAGAEGVLLDQRPTPALPRLVMPDLATGESDPILLGLEDGRALFALDLDALEPAVRTSLLSGRRIAPLREAGAG